MTHRKLLLCRRKISYLLPVRLGKEVIDLPNDGEMFIYRHTQK